MPTGRAPIHGFLGIADAYLKHKSGQRDREYLELFREQQAREGQLAQKTFEAEYGTTGPDYNRPKIGGVADYARGDLDEVGAAVNYPESAYETTHKPGLHERRLKQRQIESGDKAFLYTPITPEELDEKLDFLKEQDALAGTHMVEALDPLFRGVQKRTGNVPRLDVASSFYTMSKNPVNKRNIIARLQAGKGGDEEANKGIDTLISMVENETFADFFFPVAMEHIRGKEAEREPTKPRLYETEEGWQPREEAVGLKKPSDQKTDSLTIYNDETGETKRVYVQKGGENYVPPKGWSLRVPSRAGELGKKDLLSNCRAHYKFLLSGLIDPEFKTILPGKEKEFYAIQGKYKADVESIHRGEEPNFLTGGEKAERTIVRTGTYNGRKVVEWSDGEITYADD